MINTRYAICSERSIRDANENKMTIVDIIEDIIVPSFPFSFPRITLTWGLTCELGDKEKFKGNVSIKHNAQTLFESPVEVDFQGKLSTRCTLTLGGLVIENPGLVTVNWILDGTDEAKTSYCFNVTSKPHLANT